MRTLTFLMGREISFRIILLSLFFISEVLFIQFLDTKIPNNGKFQVYIGNLRIYRYILLKKIILQNDLLHFSFIVPQLSSSNSNDTYYKCYK